MKNILRVAFAYLAAIIGAGFASGSEILFYFVKFGKFSILGVLLSSLIFGFFVYAVFNVCHKNKSHSLNDNFPSKFRKIINVFFIAFMLVISSAMTSAISTLLNILFGINQSYTALIFTIICIIVILLPDLYVLKSVSIIGVIISLGIVASGMYMLLNRCTNVFKIQNNMVVSAISYSSFNIISVLPMLCKSSQLIKTKNQTVISGILTFLLTLIPMLTIWLLLSIYHGKIDLGDMPMLTISARQGSLFCGVYSIIIILALLSSAVTNNYGIYLKIENCNMPKPIKIMLIGVSSYLLSSVGFNTIISKLYYSIGIISLVILVYIAILSLKFEENKSI